ncbi:Hypothetical predicted protein [Marmota monax]|uniref:Uncharacterized protein n=1 Tax=Marmota monax TaxID=9995 RepID=A0A5E4AXF3_MARMO|nr:Hypothetical predicted protein [Marmota monax]
MLRPSPSVLRALPPSYLKLVPPGAPLFRPSHSCLLPLTTCRWHRFAALLLGRAVQRPPRDSRQPCLHPSILLEETLSFLLLLFLGSSPSLLEGWACDTSQLGFWVSWGSAPLARCPGPLLLPGVVNCSAFIIVTGVFKSPPSSLLLLPGSRKLTSCLSDSCSWGLAPLLPGLVTEAREQGPSLLQFHLSPRPHLWPGLVCFCLLG